MIKKYGAATTISDRLTYKRNKKNCFHEPFLPEAIQPIHISNSISNIRCYIFIIVYTKE